MSELEIPEDALDQVGTLDFGQMSREDIRERLGWLVAPIVAAELRRLAAEASEEIDGWIRDGLRRTAGSGLDSPAYRDMDKADTRLRYHRSTLLHRADELDGGAA